MWQVVFSHLKRKQGESAAAEYLAKTFFKSIRPVNLQKMARTGDPAFGAQSFYFAGFWSGCLGTHPGTASGTQTIESFHNVWQQHVHRASRRDVRLMLSELQRLYRDVWSRQHRWGQPSCYGMFPCTPNPMMLNSSRLRQAGRSPAVDFWDHRKLPNFAQVKLGTGSLQIAPDHVTTFWVMHAQRTHDRPPAEIPVVQENANIICGIIAATGQELTHLLSRAGIVVGVAGSTEWSVNSARYHELLSRMAVVMDGELVRAHWPRLGRSLMETSSRCPYVCTCAAFGVYAECEHVLFVRALTNQGIDLRLLPKRASK